MAMEISDLEVQTRYEEVFADYIKWAQELAEILEKFGRVRKELMALLAEMRQRRLPTNAVPPDFQDNAQKPTE